MCSVRFKKSLSASGFTDRVHLPLWRVDVLIRLNQPASVCHEQCATTPRACARTSLHTNVSNDAEFFMPSFFSLPSPTATLRELQNTAKWTFGGLCVLALTCCGVNRPTRTQTHSDTQNTHAHRAGYINPKNSNIRV